MWYFVEVNPKYLFKYHSLFRYENRVSGFESTKLNNIWHFLENKCNILTVENEKLSVSEILESLEGTNSE